MGRVDRKVRQTRQFATQHAQDVVEGIRGHRLNMIQNPACGVSTTLSSNRSFESEFSGSCLNVSSPAPRRSVPRMRH